MPVVAGTVDLSEADEEYYSLMLRKRAYHHSVARGLVVAGRDEDAERHLDAVGILTSCLREMRDVELH